MQAEQPINSFDTLKTTFKTWSHFYNEDPVTGEVYQPFSDDEYQEKKLDCTINNIAFTIFLKRGLDFPNSTLGPEYHLYIDKMYFSNNSDEIKAAFFEKFTNIIVISPSIVEIKMARLIKAINVSFCKDEAEILEQMKSLDEQYSKAVKDNKSVCILS